MRGGCGEASGRQVAQAAEPSDFDAVLVAVFVVAEDESDAGDEAELPDSPEDPEGVVVPEPWLELLDEWLLEPELRRESLRESLR